MTFETYARGWLERQTKYASGTLAFTTAARNGIPGDRGNQAEPASPALENLLAKLAKFNVEFDQHFGADAALSPANLIDAKKFQLKTPDVTIQVNPERTDLVQTRIIGGVKYLLICADEGVGGNGIQVGLDE